MKSTEVGRRVIGVPITVDLFFDWIVQGAEIHAQCIEGLPPDAMARRVYHDPEWGRVVFVFEHESFDLVPEGCRIPMRNIVWQAQEKKTP